MHHALRLSPTLLISLLLAACGGPVEEIPFEESLETEQGIVVSPLNGPCSASLVCSGGTTISCTSIGAPDTCFTGKNFVSCDGIQKNCPTSGGCAPAHQDIVEYIPACYPSQHPHGRYGLASTESGVTYTWSSNYATFAGGNTGSYVVIKATSVGYFTLTVTARRTGCSTSTVFSENFYAEDAASCY